MDQTLRRIRGALVLFIVGLVVSGLTAFPLQSEVNLLAKLVGGPWILTVRDGLMATYASYPFMAYGTDWLAFAHLAIALFFVAPLRDPVRNVAVIQTGLLVCVLVLPLALICGPLRGIPFYWRLIDCSFGVFGSVPLWCALGMTRRLSLRGIDPPPSLQTR